MPMRPAGIYWLQNAPAEEEMKSTGWAAACEMDKYNQLARGTSFVSDCCSQEDLTTCAFKGNSSRWLRSVSST